MNHPPAAFAGLLAINQFRSSTGGLPKAWATNDAKIIVDIASGIAKELKLELGDQVRYELVISAVTYI